MSEGVITDDIEMGENEAPKPRRGAGWWASMIGAVIAGVISTVAFFFFFQAAMMLVSPAFLELSLDADMGASFEAGREFGRGFRDGVEEAAGEPPTEEEMRRMIKIGVILVTLGSGAVLALSTAATAFFNWRRAKLSGAVRSRAAGSMRFVEPAFAFAQGAAWLYLRFAILGAVFIGGLAIFGSAEMREGYLRQTGMTPGAYFWLFGPMGVIVAFAMLYAFRGIRSVIREVASGEAFAARNGQALIRSGLALIAYQLIELIYNGLAKGALPEALVAAMAPFHSIHLWPGFMGLMLLAIGAAFREGARLREEQDLTI